MSTRIDSIPAIGASSGSRNVQDQRNTSFRNCVARALAVVALVAIVMGWAGVFRARAQAQPDTQISPPYVYFYLNGEQVVIPQVQWEIVIKLCGTPLPGLPNRVWQQCAEGALLFVTSYEGQGSSGIPPFMTRDAAQASAGSGLTLSSGTPSLPFLGNPLVQVGFVPNSTNVSTATAAYTTDLRRNSDCSLDEDFVLPTASTPSTAMISSVTGAQDYLHQLAGLTTKADVFANGCAPQVLGIPATGGAVLIGITPGGASIAAQLAGNGLYVIVTDPTANTIKTTQLTNSQNAGYFSAVSLRNNATYDLIETNLTDPATQKPATAVLLGNGDGTFQSPVYYDISDNGLGEFTIDDVNGDGIPDIVELTQSNGAIANVATLLGKGDGTFTVGPVSALTGFTANAPADVQPLTGDFNGDGKKDLLVAGTVLFGSGNGAFTVGPTNTVLAGDGNYLFPNAVGDLRNSGKLDVVATDNGSVSIFYGNGDGTFTAGPTYAALPDYMQVTITDLDGDGNADIVLGTSTGGVYTIGGYDTPVPMYQVLMGRGDGTFVDSQAYLEGNYNLNGGPQIASADFNGDGKADLLVFQNGNGLTANNLLMLPGDGKGNLAAAITSPLTINKVTQIVSADMNGDGKPDAVLIGNSQLAVLLNQGTGTFAGEQDYTLPASAVSVATGDFNGDGLMDIAVGVAGGVYVYPGQANHTLGTPVKIDSSANPTGLAAGSLTGDGRSDLIVADQGSTSPQVNGALHVYLSNADGTFTAKTAPTTTATLYTVAALGDLNKDGKLDLLVAGEIPGTSGGAAVPTLFTLLGNGDGTFQAAKALTLADADGIGATSIALADFNKSGNLGAVLANPLDYTEVLLGNGDGTLTETLMALGQRPYSVAAVDLSGDGYPELLVGQSNDMGQGTLSVFLNSAVWTAAPPPLASTTTALTASAATVVAGSTVTFTATVTGASGSTGTPTGTVTFMDGATTLGTGTVSSTGVATYSTAALSAGAHSITAVYGGDANFSGSTSTAVTVTVTAAPVLTATTTALTASATSAQTGTSITFNATVTPASGTAMPTGTVTFTDGASTLGTGTLSAGGSATYSTSSLAAGSHSITAVYSGDSNFSGSTSAALTVTITAPAPDFSLSINPASGTETSSSPATASLTVTPASGFNASVSFACSGLPSGVACSFNPATVTPTGSPLSTTVTFAASSSAMASPSAFAKRAPWTFAALGLGFWLFGRARRYRALLRGVSMTALAVALFGFSGCGSGTHKQTSQTSTVTITATSGSTSHTVTYSLQTTG
ncbi:MAG: FG-GAP-like repeat-containing protein [Acidobacteriota bacterium]